MSYMIQISRVTDELDSLISELEELDVYGSLIKPKRFMMNLINIRNRLYNESYPKKENLDDENLDVCPKCHRNRIEVRFPEPGVKETYCQDCGWSG